MPTEFTGRSKFLWRLSTLMNWLRLHHVNANKLYESYDYTLQTRQAQMVLT